MFKKFIVHNTKPFNEDYDVVVFSGKLQNPSFYFIPGLKYKRILSKNTNKWQSGATSRDEIEGVIKDPLLTRIVHLFHDKLYYGRQNRIRKLYHNLYQNYIFPLTNQVE